MTKLIGATILGCMAFLLASCGSDRAKDEVPTPAKETTVAIKAPAKSETPKAKSARPQVKLHVEGIVERLKLV
jgi:hypothetical protein